MRGYMQLTQEERCQKPHRKRYGRYDRRGVIPGRASIEERLRIVDRRRRIGDRELDTLIGKHRSGVLVSLTERTSRLALPAQDAHQGRRRGQAGHPAPAPAAGGSVHTRASDNGKEFARHEAIADALNAKFYFAHPYASWERGLNENTNGLIRQYFPKGSDFSTLTEEDLQRVMDKLNNRPRKCLGMKTPNQVFFGINPPVALAS